MAEFRNLRYPFTILVCSYICLSSSQSFCKWFYLSVYALGITCQQTTTKVISSLSTVYKSCLENVHRNKHFWLSPNCLRGPKSPLRTTVLLAWLRKDHKPLIHNVSLVALACSSLDSSFVKTSFIGLIWRHCSSWFCPHYMDHCAYSFFQQIL